MSGTKVKKKVSFETKDFLFEYFLWVVGILLIAVPTLFKVTNEWLNTDVSNLEKFDFWKSFISDYEFLYVFCSVGFILIIELYFLNKWHKIKGIIFVSILFYSLILLVLYTISTFNPNWSTHVLPEQTAKLNIIAFVMLFIVGTLNLVLAHTNIKRQLVNEE